ncbi:MarR family winged helix-turn-helix transcriptional regulator [Deinococcus sp.]|uniref:MarR family winged helix-turn-helix transcriptional regulator n=1 Tax=Deinococcus sp. TaxID=47478 RepID=UPI003CC591D8
MSSAPSSSAALEACLRLARAAATLTHRLDSRLGSLHGLSFNDFTLLLHLSRAEGGKLRRIDLAQRLGLSASGVTRSLLPLEKIGLVSRQSDARDARVGYAVLTPAGLELLEHALVSAQQSAQEWLSPLPAPRFDQLSATLSVLTGE